MQTAGKSKSTAPARSVARLAAVQALYQMEMSGQGVEAAVREFEEFRLNGELEGEKIHGADRKFFNDILRGTVEMQGRLDPYLQRQLADGWKLKRIDSTARAILRAALYEMVRRPDVPFRVVIDEYMEVAASFFEGDEPKFINGVLNAAAREVRADELGDAHISGS
ncbi:MAG: transcription antitermination factor NusB [Pseudomonadota bacterium]